MTGKTIEIHAKRGWTWALSTYLKNHLIGSVIVASLVCILLAVGIFVLFFHNQAFSLTVHDWSEFGVYFASFVTPILTFLNILFLAYSFMEERRKRNAEIMERRGREVVQKEKEAADFYATLCFRLEPKFDQLQDALISNRKSLPDVEMTSITEFQNALKETLNLFKPLVSETAGVHPYVDYFLVRYRASLLKCFTVGPVEKSVMGFFLPHFIEKFPDLRDAVFGPGGDF